MLEEKINETINNMGRNIFGTDQPYINDLKFPIKTNRTVPTHTPKKFLDCFYLYWDGSSTYELYIYTNNSWKKTSLS